MGFGLLHGTVAERGIVAFLGSGLHKLHSFGPGYAKLDHRHTNCQTGESPPRTASVILPNPHLRLLLGK